MNHQTIPVWMKQDQSKARDEITEVFSKISKKRSRSSSDADNDSPVRKERKVKPIYKLSSDESAGKQIKKKNFDFTKNHFVMTKNQKYRLK